MATPDAIHQLRETLATVGQCGFRRRRVMPFGVDAIDARLADGGLRLDALHEVAATTPGLADEAAAALFVAGIATRAWGPVLWVARRSDLFAPDLARAGLTGDRIIRVEAGSDPELVALMAEGLHHRGLGAVIGETRRIAAPATRQLQSAAEAGRTIALLLKRHSRRTGDPLGASSAAVTRWRVAAASRRRWQIELTRQQGGDAFDQPVTPCDATGRCAVPPSPVHRLVTVEPIQREAA